jgi:ParB-like chromosome segregation protein Spo0J
MDTIERIAITKLVIDPNIYPREKVNAHNIARLRQAIQSGKSLPPIIAEAGTNRIIDGVHRYKAYLEEYEGDKVVNVIFRKYANDLEAYQESARLNAEQGMPLSETDKASVLDRVVNKFGGTLEDGARILGITIKRAQALASRITTVLKEAEEISGGSPLPVSIERRMALKPNLLHLKERQGGVISYEQGKVNNSCLGVPVLRLAREIIRHVEKKTLDLTNQPLLHELRTLANLIMEQPWFIEPHHGTALVH